MLLVYFFGDSQRVATDIFFGEYSLIFFKRTASDVLLRGFSNVILQRGGGGL